MLKQLAHLSVEADGRYATDSELQFLKNYLQSVELRVSAYKKIRDSEDAMMDQVEAKLTSLNPNWCHKGSRNVADLCRRDRKNTLKYSAAAMLTDDLDRLRDSLLIWLRTIVKAVNDEGPAQLTWRVMQDVLKQNLTAEEAELMMPAIQLDQALLG